MNNKTKTAAVLTIMVTIAHLIILIILQSKGNLPFEKTLALMTGDSFQLPFKVSMWWGLMVWPIVMFLVGSFYNLETVIGHEPKNGSDEVWDKYLARTLSTFMPMIGLALGAAMAVLQVIFAPFYPDGVGGPFSALANLAMFTVMVYVILGTMSAALFMTFRNFYFNERSLTEMYLGGLGYFVKNGLISNLPFIVGHTAGYMIRSLFAGLLKIAGAIYQAFNRKESAV